MASKKYIVRDGFVVVLKIVKADGSFIERSYQSGEDLTLEDADAALHQHKLEFASQKDRDASMAAEQQASIATKAQQSPAELVSALISALTMAQAGAGVAQAAPSA